MARPTSYSAERAQPILDRLANGESLAAICGEGDAPGTSTVARWREAFPEFRDAYERARQTGLDVIADDILRIADEEPGTLQSGATDSGAVAHQRLRFDARRWYLSKLAPKRYGDKLTVAGDEENPLVINDMSAATRLAQLLAMAEARKSRTSDDSAEPEDDYSDLV